MVSSGAFWVAISYRLAAYFPGIGSTCGVEIYWRSFRHFGKSVGKKWQKWAKNWYWTENRAHDSSESVKRVIPKITSWKSRGGGQCPIAGDANACSHSVSPLGQWWAFPKPNQLFLVPLCKKITQYYWHTGLTFWVVQPRGNQTVDKPRQNFTLLAKAISEGRT